VVARDAHKVNCYCGCHPPKRNSGVE